MNLIFKLFALGNQVPLCEDFTIISFFSSLTFLIHFLVSLPNYNFVMTLVQNYQV